MTRVIAYLARFALIVVGYLAASLAASAFLHVVTLGALGFSAAEAPAVIAGSAVFSVPLIALFAAYFAFIPSVAAILVAELFGRRDWLTYALAGGGVGLVVVYVFRRAAEDGHDAVTDPRFMMAVVGAGIAGGLAYWLVAGRLAAGWMPPCEPPTSPGPSGS